MLTFAMDSPHLHHSGAYGGLMPHPWFSDTAGGPVADGILVAEGCRAAGILCGSKEMCF